MVTLHHSPGCIEVIDSESSVFAHSSMGGQDCSFFPHWNGCHDHHVVCVHAGGMPAPEQSPVTEEGLLLTIRDSSTGRNMEADNTANKILASVKEQVLCFSLSYFTLKLPLIL